MLLNIIGNYRPVAMPVNWPTVLCVLAVSLLLFSYFMGKRLARAMDQNHSEQPLYEASDILLQKRNSSDISIPVASKVSVAAKVVIGILILLLVFTPFSDLFRLPW